MSTLNQLQTASPEPLSTTTMASIGPYTYIQCPCSNASTTLGNSDGQAAAETENEIDGGTDDMAFDPRAPRSNFSLYPLEYLLYCEDCRDIRCPQCITDEIVTYYCPNCIFEVPSSNIKSEGNRCTRSCFQCPVCIGILVVTPLDRVPTTPPPESAPPTITGGPYALNCTYCLWSSTEIGIEFEKSNGVYGQLAKIKNGGAPKLTSRELKERRKDASGEATLPDSAVDPEIQFSNLKAFYQGQMSSDVSSGFSSTAIGDLGLSSPGSLGRIMSLYTGGSIGSKRNQAKKVPMGEASNTSEGLKLVQLDESTQLKKLHASRFEDTVSLQQNSAQVHECRFMDELRPVPTLLRTKRSKRCPTCRHILTRPEAKVLNTRYRMRLKASNYIPAITIKLMNEGPPPPSRALPVIPSLPILEAQKPTQFILTFKNPIYEPIKVTLATTSTTTGRFPSKVTLLCPQFTVGPNIDVWDDALNTEKRRTFRPDENLQAEAGKIWDKSENWTSIVLEVVPSSLDLKVLQWAKGQGEDVDDGPLKEDEDIVEIPLFVRVEWEAEVQDVSNKDKGAKEKKELAYWTVLGVGKIGDGSSRERERPQ